MLAYIFKIAQSYFFRLLTTTGIVLGIEEQGTEGTLRYTREAIWSYVIGHCSSFRNRNCYVQFSEIFLSSLFETLTAYEKLPFQTFCVHRAMCRSCNIHIDKEGHFQYIFSYRNPQSRIDQDLLKVGLVILES